MNTIMEHDAITGETIERPMTSAELAQKELDNAAAQAEAGTVDAQEAARESGRAKLKALGLTDDEIAALIP